MVWVGSRSGLNSQCCSQVVCWNAGSTLCKLSTSVTGFVRHVRVGALGMGVIGVPGLGGGKDLCILWLGRGGVDCLVMIRVRNYDQGWGVMVRGGDTLFARSTI